MNEKKLRHISFILKNFESSFQEFFLFLILLHKTLLLLKRNLDISELKQGL